jgi:hypothetical protein
LLDNGRARTGIETDNGCLELAQRALERHPAFAIHHLAVRSHFSSLVLF